MMDSGEKYFSHRVLDLVLVILGLLLLILIFFYCLNGLCSGTDDHRAKQACPRKQAVERLAEFRDREPQGHYRVIRWQGRQEQTFLDSFHRDQSQKPGFGFGDFNDSGLNEPGGLKDAPLGEPGLSWAENSQNTDGPPYWRPKSLKGSGLMAPRENFLVSVIQSVLKSFGIELNSRDCGFYISWSGIFRPETLKPLSIEPGLRPTGQKCDQNSLGLLADRGQASERGAGFEPQRAEPGQISAKGSFLKTTENQKANSFFSNIVTRVSGGRASLVLSFETGTGYTGLVIRGSQGKSSPLSGQEDLVFGLPDGGLAFGTVYDRDNHNLSQKFQGILNRQILEPLKGRYQSKELWARGKPVKTVFVFFDPQCQEARRLEADGLGEQLAKEKVQLLWVPVSFKKGSEDLGAYFLAHGQWLEDPVLLDFDREDLKDERLMVRDNTRRLLRLARGAFLESPSLIWMKSADPGYGIMAGIPRVKDLRPWLAEIEKVWPLNLGVKGG